MSRLLLTRFLPLSLLTYAVHQFSLVPALIGGTFECDDVSIGHISTGDTISLRMLLALVSLPTLLIMQWSEQRRLSRELGFKNRFFLAWKRTWQNFVHLLVSSALCLLINEILKALVAWPRPNFITSCNPDPETIDCSQGPVLFKTSICRGQDVWVDGFKRPITDSMRSFPSGHAQLAVFNAIFVIMYLRSKEQSLASALFQTCFLAMAVFVCVSRVMDKRHHWRDVGAGATIGALTAILVVRMSRNPFGEETKSQSDLSVNEKCDKKS